MGSFVRYVGSKGEGPGEFTVVDGMGFASIIDVGVEMADGPYHTAERMGESVPPNLRVAVEEGLDLPGYYSPVRAIFVTHEGHMWLHEGVGDLPDGGDWTVLDPDLHVAFRVRYPTSRRAPGSDGR